MKGMKLEVLKLAVEHLRMSGQYAEYRQDDYDASIFSDLVGITVQDYKEVEYTDELYPKAEQECIVIRNFVMLATLSLKQQIEINNIIKQQYLNNHP